MNVLKQLLYFTLMVPVMAAFWLIAACILIPLFILFGFFHLMEFLSKP